MGLGAITLTEKAANKRNVYDEVRLFLTNLTRRYKDRVNNKCGGAAHNMTHMLPALAGNLHI